LCKKLGNLYCLTGRQWTGPNGTAYLAAVTVCDLYSPARIRQSSGFSPSIGGLFQVRGMSAVIHTVRHTPAVEGRVGVVGEADADYVANGGGGEPFLNNFQISATASDQYAFSWDVEPGYGLYVESSLDENTWNYEVWAAEEDDQPVSLTWYVELPPGSEQFYLGDFVYNQYTYFRARHQTDDNDPPAAAGDWYETYLISTVVPDFIRAFGVTQDSQQLFTLDWRTAQPELTIIVELSVNGGPYNEIINEAGNRPIVWDAGSPFSPGTELEFRPVFTNGVNTSTTPQTFLLTVV
jgi:hypothetical protein